jgi:hypothetical protein
VKARSAATPHAFGGIYRRVGQEFCGRGTSIVKPRHSAGGFPAGMAEGLREPRRRLLQDEVKAQSAATPHASDGIYGHVGQEVCGGRGRWTMRGAASQQASQPSARPGKGTASGPSAEG